MAGDSKQALSISSLLLWLSFLPAAQASYSVDLSGLVASSVTAFFLFAIFLIVLVIRLTWENWFPAIQRSKGKVKMPSSYWKKKKEMKKQKKLELARASRSMTTTTMVPALENGLNGHATSISRARDTASWVQGWNTSTRPQSTAYEELAVAMDLDEEQEDPQFRIVTSVEKDNNLITTNATRITDDLGRPSMASAVVKDHIMGREVRSVESVRVLNGGEPSNPIYYTSVQTGSTRNEEKKEEDLSQFRIVAAVVDDEALDLGPFKSTDTQTGRGGGGAGGGGEGGEGRGGVSEQVVTISLDDNEQGQLQSSSYSHFLDSSRVVF